MLGDDRRKRQRTVASLALPFLILAGLALAACTAPELSEAESRGMAPPETQTMSVTHSGEKPVAVILRVPDPGKLSGMSATDLISLIGKPDFRRVEAPGQLWQYRSADCVLDVFLYGKGRSFRVIHAETRGRDPDASGGHCGEGAHALHGEVQQSRLLRHHVPKPLLLRHRSSPHSWA